MSAKSILFALLAACGVPYNTPPTEQSAEQPDEPDGQPPDDIKDATYFCCLDVDAKTKSGDGCVTIGEKEVDRCSTVLACQEFTKKDGKVTCL